MLEKLVSYSIGVIKKIEICRFVFKMYYHPNVYLFGCFIFCAFNFWILVYSPLYNILIDCILSEMTVSRLKVT